MALDEKDIQKINDMIGAGTAKLTEQVGSIAGSMKTLTDNFEKTVNEAIDKKVSPLAETVAKIGAPADDKDKNKDKPAPGDEPEWFKKHREAQEALLKPVLEFTAAKQGEEKKAAERAAAKALIAKTLAEKKLGGLLKNEQVLERLVNAAPKDADAVMAAVEAERKFAASLGIKPESFGADVAGEGGRTPDGGKPNVEEMKKKTSEAIGAAAKARAAIV